MTEVRGDGTSLSRLSFPAGPHFFDDCARHIVAANLAQLPDLSAGILVVPNLALAPALRDALARAAGCALLLPRIVTLSSLAGTALPHLPLTPLSDASRLIGLYQQLERRNWFDERSRWEVCAELIALFDELTERTVGLPTSEADFIASLEQAYDLRGSSLLHFEARLVHELWRAEAAGAPGRKAAEALALARVAERIEAPLIVIGDGALSTREEAFCLACAARQPVHVLLPARHGDAAVEPLLRAMSAAWPPLAALEQTAPLPQRAAALRSACPTSPLAKRVRLLAANSMEEEAAAVAQLVRQWLAAGKRDIALIAADRVAARRARALLEREQILVEDETGWKLSTTRAAALVDAWLEVFAADAYCRDVLDLLKSPFVFADMDREAHRRAVLEIESLIAADNLVSGLDRYAKSLLHRGASAEAQTLIARLRTAREAMPKSTATPAAWLARLEASLDRLGALPLLSADAAGRSLLEFIAVRREELAQASLRLDFAAWRDWLNRELENAMFRDRGIASPVVMTHIAAARLRAFDAAIVIGADSEHLQRAAHQAIFANATVRAELGLSTPRDAAQRLEDDIALLIATCGEIAATWQQWRGEEAGLLSPPLARLALLHEAAYGNDLKAGLPPAASASAPAPIPLAAPAPIAPPALLPTAISASGYASLVACPYQYFARHVLRLAEQEEVRESLEKRDYGELVHRILQRFHALHPQLEGHFDDELVDALETISREVFAEAVERNFLETAWQLRWQARIPAYIGWQRRREAEGWRYYSAEVAVQRELPLASGAALRLHGRIDRLDGSSEHCAVLDYKTQNRQRLRERLKDQDAGVQLAVYTVLQGEAVAEAAYVALDDEHIDALSLDDPQVQALAHRERLIAIFDVLHAGAGMPANGVDAVCTWCEMRGLCRRDYWS